MNINAETLSHSLSKTVQSFTTAIVLFLGVSNLKCCGEMMQLVLFLQDLLPSATACVGKDLEWLGP